MQWDTDGHIPVEAHDSQKEAVGAGPGSREEHLGGTAHIGDGLAPHDQAGQHPRNDAQRVAGLGERQEGEEEVHGGVQVAVQPDDHDNEDIGSQGSKIQK